MIFKPFLRDRYYTFATIFFPIFTNKKTTDERFLAHHSLAIKQRETMSLHNNYSNKAEQYRITPNHTPSHHTTTPHDLVLIHTTQNNNKDDDKNKKKSSRPYETQFILILRQTALNISGHVYADSCIYLLLSIFRLLVRFRKANIAFTK